MVASINFVEAPAEAAAWPEQGPEKLTRLTIGSSSALVESEVSLPLYFTAAPGLKVGSVSAEIKFPGKPLSFVKAEKSGSSGAIGAQVKAEVSSEPKEEGGLSTLKLTISAPEEKATREALPDGVIAYLVFQLSKEAEADTEIVLQNKASALTAEEQPKRVEPVLAYEGKITVLGAPIISCFFYMH